MIRKPKHMFFRVQADFMSRTLSCGCKTRFRFLGFGSIHWLCEALGSLSRLKLGNVGALTVRIGFWGFVINEKYHKLY